MVLWLRASALYVQVKALLLKDSTGLNVLTRLNFLLRNPLIVQAAVFAGVLEDSTNSEQLILRHHHASVKKQSDV